MRISILILFIFVLNHSGKSQTDSLKQNLEGTWQSEKDGYYLTFKNGISCSYHKDSTISSSTPCPYQIENDFVIIKCHPLEQTHYKIREITNQTMRLNIYWIKTTKEEIIQGKPNSIRLKSKGKNRKFKKVKN
jgi:hypothetical protein